MLKDSPAFSGFSVDNLNKAKQFYSEVLGLAVEQDEMGLRLNIANSQPIFVYEKADHQPATFTILNFPAEDIDATVSALTAKGVEFEHYPGLNDDEDVLRGRAANRGPDIAWFKDPAGNILSVLQD